MAKVGDTVDLRCRIEPPVNATDLTTVWSRTESHLKPPYACIRRNGHVLEDRVLNELYHGQRCSVSEEKLAGGDLSLEMRGLQFSDEGSYQCEAPDLQSSKSCSTDLRVGNVSQPEIYSAGPKDGGLSLTCDSGCWYPRPEMSWLDSEGIVRPAEDPVTYRRSEHCYVVQSNLTARGAGNFTCRVHLSHINHTAEAHHDIPGLNAGRRRIIPIVVVSLWAVISLILLAWFFCSWENNLLNGVVPGLCRVVCGQEPSPA